MEQFCSFHGDLDFLARCLCHSIVEDFMRIPPHLLAAGKPKSKLRFFPTCQVRVVRFYVSWLPPAASCRLLPPSAAFRLLRTSTTTIHAKCSLPDLNRDQPRQVFPAGPQPRESTPSVPCRTSTARIHAKCSLPNLNRDHPRPVFPAGPQPRESTPSVPCRTSTAGENAKRYAR